MKSFVRSHPLTGRIELHQVGYVPAMVDGQPGSIRIERRTDQDWQIPAAVLTHHVYATPAGAVLAAVRLRARQ